MGNLVSLADRTTEEQREIARMGGIRSGEVRRERKRLREALEEALSMPCEVEGVQLTNVEAVAAALVNEAKGGNVRAFVEIRDTCEGKPSTHIVTDTIPPERYAEIEAMLMGGNDDER